MKEHIKRVKEYGCLVCRRPAQAHHCKYILPVQMGVRVPDRYCVPLCADHHDNLHRRGERRFWETFPHKASKALDMDPTGSVASWWELEFPKIIAAYMEKLDDN
jgi:hypothetical protein